MRKVIKVMSLNLLNTKALNADLNVLTLLTQKLIKKYEVIPINSHPNNIVDKLLDNINKTILYKKLINKNKNLSRKISSLI